MQKNKTTHKPQVFPTGLLKWNLPGSDLCITWLGAGTRLLLCHDVPGGLMTGIESEGSNGTYQTRAEAQSAVECFIQRASQNGGE